MNWPSLKLLQIPEQNGLDQINVYWHDVRPGQGYVTITCWGAAWTAWFGAMGDVTIEQFFISSGPDYLVNKLIPVQWMRSTKKLENYLTRIVRAIQEALKQQHTGRTTKKG